MELTPFMNATTRALGRTGLRIRKASPELLVGAGVVGLLAAGVMAARATMKAKPVIDAVPDALEVIEFHGNNDNDYTPSLQRRDTIYVYRSTVLKLAKLYAPAITMAGVGVACVLGGHHLLRQRNVALAAAYKVLETSYGEYRKRVRTEVGDKRELEIYQDVREVETVDEKGKKVVKKIHGPNAGNGYGAVFDQLNPNYLENASLNLSFILSVQRWANIVLNIRGYMFLNEVYYRLGLPQTTAGQVVGWRSDGNGGVDGFIDFGIDNPDNEMARAFIRGDERAVWLDFNVDGEIYKQAF